MTTPGGSDQVGELQNATVACIKWSDGWQWTIMADCRAGYRSGGVTRAMICHGKKRCETREEAFAAGTAALRRRLRALGREA